MKLLKKLAEIPWPVLILVCAVPFVLSAALNHGFIASDEYWTGITRYLPAQKSTIGTLLQEDDVKAPTQLLPMYAVAQAALSLGVENPFQQYVCVVFVLGVLGTAILFGAFRFFHKTDLQQRLSFLMLALYFGAPAVLTRPMFESLAAPFLAWSALFAVRYDERLKISDLLWGTTFGAIAFCLRPQTGICCLIFPLLALLHRRGKDFLTVAAWGVGLVGVTGLPDLFIRGSWHRSLFDLISYNVKFGGDYGHQPWWYYLPLIFLLSFGPWLFANYGRDWSRKYLKEFRAVFVMIILFVFEHSLFTHKFERFVIPLIPMIILLLVPIVELFLTQGRRWRVGSLFVVNVLLWLPATFSEPQGHLIAMTRFFETHPEMSPLTSLDEAVSWLPDVFSARGPVSLFESTSEGFRSVEKSCPIWILVRKPFAGPMIEKDPRLEVVQVFESGTIDKWSFKLNPEHNIRRSPISLLGCRN